MAIVLRRRVIPTRLLATTLALVLAFDPLAPLSASFWLSFAAVGVLVVMAMDICRRFPSPGPWAVKARIVVWGWTRTQLWLLVGMGPVLLIAFQKMSVVAPLANILVVPLVGMLVVPLCLIGLVSWSMDLQTVALWVIGLCSRLLDLAWSMLSFLGNPSWAAVEIGSPEALPLATAIMGLLLLGFLRALPARHLGFLLLLPMLSMRPETLTPGEFQAVVLDTGQGLSVVIRTNSRVLVYDVGAAYPGGFNLGEAAVLPHLRQARLGRVDMLIASHGDIDHIGGAKALAQGLPVKRFLSSAPDSKRAPSGGIPCHWNQSWHWDGVHFRVLWPPPGMPYRGNDSSCVVRVESDHGSILLTGDIEAPVERELVARYGSQLSSDALLVPHHGSRTSSSTALLARVDPRVAVVSSGYLNRFRHPHDDVVRRFHRQNIPLLNTAYEGAVSLGFRAGGIAVSGARESLEKFWLEPGKADFVSLNRHLNKRLSGMLESPVSSTGLMDQ
jgi:competence protein ComEC